MGGVSQPMPVSPLAPAQVTTVENVPDNSYMMNSKMFENDGMMQMAAAAQQQNYLMMQQQAQSNQANLRADTARAAQEDMINADIASEQAELDERNYRKEKGKKDLLFANASGLTDSYYGDDDDDMLLLGGA